MMAKGTSTTNCPTIKSSVDFGSQGSSGIGQPAKTLLSRHDAEQLDRSIRQAIQRRDGKPVKAFVVMALHDDGEIVTHTTDHVKQCTAGIFASDAKERLRIAHEKSMMRASLDHGSHTYGYLSTSAFGEDSLNDKRFRHDVIRGQTAHIDEESCYAYRPASARTFGSASDWPSDEECSRRSRGSSAVETQIVSPSNQRPAQMSFLLICEAPKIEDFISRNLRTMQQLAVKIIAKAWIKGICPRKQALFPYNKKKREREGKSHLSGPEPGWWPDVSKCKFLEPDHITRVERVNLCLHLLRLRPTPAQLKEWNKSSIEAHHTHATKGWTEFLRELAPPSIFDEARELDGGKTDERKKLLAQIYDLAKREEDYLNGEIDADDRFWWSNDPVKPASKKKVRRDYDASIDESDVDSLPTGGPPSKRSKKTSLATTPAGSPSAISSQAIESDHSIQDCKPPNHVERPSSAGVAVKPCSRSASALSSQKPWTQELDLLACDSKDVGLGLRRPTHDHVQGTQGASAHSHMCPISAPWIDAASSIAFHTSVPASCQPMSQGFSIETPGSTFPGQHDYEFPQHSPAYGSSNMRCFPYVDHQLAPPQIETLSVSGIGTPPVQPQPSYTGQVYYNKNNNATYYDRPDNAQSALLSAPSTPNMNMQFTYTESPSVSLPHCTTSQPPGFVIDPSNYQYHPEVGQNPYPPSAPRYSSTFQAPARVERGFTGHASGVGGGAHT